MVSLYIALSPKTLNTSKESYHIISHSSQLWVFPKPSLVIPGPLQPSPHYIFFFSISKLPSFRHHITQLHTSAIFFLSPLFLQLIFDFFKHSLLAYFFSSLFVTWLLVLYIYLYLLPFPIFVRFCVPFPTILLSLCVLLKSVN